MKQILSRDKNQVIPIPIKNIEATKMEVESEESHEMAIPINSRYGGGHGHMIHHDHDPTINGGLISSTRLTQNDVPYKKIIKYKECLKNHAASMGGNATDGCGEFMATGEEGSLEALTCSACNCHRNFHRKEVEGEDCYSNPHHLNRVGRKVILGHHHHPKTILSHESQGYHPIPMPSRAAPLFIGSFPSESDEQEDIGGVVIARPYAHNHHHQEVVMKKRFRTKFSGEQKEKLLKFAEKVGWKIQKQEEGVVQQICQEVGIKRRVLKVWMHNNKHNLAKKNINTSNVQHQL